MSHPLRPTEESVEPAAPQTGTAPMLVDWLVAAGIAVVGCVMAIAGVGVIAYVDRASLDEAVGAVRTSWLVLSHAEAIEVAVAVVEWSGIGLLVVGAGLLIGAAGYLVAQSRLRRARGVSGRPNHRWANAITGAVATVALVVVPISPAIGGAVAGRLDRRRSGTPGSVGAAAGGLAGIPVTLVLPFTLWGLIRGALAVEAPALAGVVGGALVLVWVLATGVAAALGGFGGYLAGKI